MLAALTLLLSLQLAGEILVRVTGLPLPGPVIGMALLFAGLSLRAALLARPRVPEALEGAADGLLRHLSLLFVPAGVGVISLLGVVERDLVPIVAALLVSTIVTIAVTALAMRALDRLAGHRGEDADGSAGDGPGPESGR